MVSVVTAHKRLPKMPPLTETLIKELLQDIERSGKSRSDFNLLTLVNSKPDTYGAVNSEKRRSIQKKFDLLKRKTPQQYQNYLDKFNVDPSKALRREIRMSQRSITSDSGSDNLSAGSDDSSIYSVGNSSVTKASSVKQGFPPVNFVKNPSPEIKKMYSPPSSVGSSGSSTASSQVLNQIEIMEFITKLVTSSDWCVGQSDCPRRSL